MRQHLKTLRESKKLTQQEFAKLVGIDRSTYANIELGHKNPSYPVALRIKEKLDYSGDDIFIQEMCRKRTV